MADLFSTTSQSSCLRTELYTAHATTNATTSELFLGWHLRTHFNFFRKQPKEVIRTNQAEQKQLFDGQSIDVSSPDLRYWSEIIVGKQMDCRNGTVFRNLGPVTSLVDVGQRQVWKWHLDQLRHRGGEIQQPAIPSAGFTNSSSDGNDFYPFEQDVPPPERDAARGMGPPQDPPPDRQPSPGGERPYPKRERRPPERYGRPICW